MIWNENNRECISSGMRDPSSYQNDNCKVCTQKQNLHFTEHVKYVIAILGNALCLIKCLIACSDVCTVLRFIKAALIKPDRNQYEQTLQNRSIENECH